MTPDFLAIKVGGSLFSRKDEPGSLDDDAVTPFARNFARLAETYRGRMVLISGGGAFGHGAIRDHDSTHAFSLAGLTEATFEVKKRWAEKLRGIGVDAFPLQLAAMCTLRNGIPQLRSEVLRDVLDHGALPVLAGDALFDEHGKLWAFSSDRVPEVLLPMVEGRLRVVTLTDVDGIVTDGAGGDTILPEVDARSPEQAYAALWGSSEWDATGAMHTKLDALVTCARRGAECFIMRGDPGSDLEFLTAPFSSWPAHVRSTRITTTASA
uniref:Isopentenyl phosphate kinase n=1 Tax=Streptomyces wedmorensis TaxID=43759 RepID=Q56187_STRWE|nr:fosfomycin resistance kinase FomA [Streptomyces wedmorensis]BAA32493.1 fomA [Streptomyces wedmorensis]